MTMSVFDWVLVAIFALSTFWGLKTGLIDALLSVIAVYVALLLGGQFAFRLVNFFSDDIESRAIATAVGYAVIFIVVFVAARIAGKVLKTGVTFMMLGPVNKLGGLIFGVLAGVLLVSGSVGMAARFVYDPETKTPIAAQEKQFRERLHGWMVEGKVPGAVLDARDALPWNFLGIMPDDFARSLDALRADIDRKQGKQA
jgi:uncharacterized membrane protein required for colicin V production